MARKVKKRLPTPALDDPMIRAIQQKLVNGIDTFIIT